jgi:hypothetical protein
MVKAAQEQTQVITTAINDRSIALAKLCNNIFFNLKQTRKAINFRRKKLNNYQKKLLKTK